MDVVTISIPARGRHKLESHGTIGYLAGEVPRLVIRAGSDAFDIWEGQCLPYSANSAYICNPFGRQITVTITYGGPICYSINAGADGRHAEKTLYYMRWARYQADAVKRTGMVFLAERGRYEISPELSGHDAYQARVNVIRGASPEFLAAKPSHIFLDTQKPFSPSLVQIEGCAAICGTFVDADIDAWVAATVTFERVQVATYTGYGASIKSITEPGVAVSVSFPEGYIPNGNIVVRDLGQLAEDFD